MRERRAHKRISIDFEATLLYDGETTLVRVKNCSAYGACIMSISGIFPCTIPDVNLLILVAKKKLKLSGKIVRVTKINKSSDTIGLQFIKPPKKYLEYLSTL